MNELFNQFMESHDSPSTKSIIKSFQALGEYDYSGCSPESIEQIILSMKPKCIKEIITICYVLKAYGKFLGNKNLQSIVQDINKNELWFKAKPNATQKFLSYSDYKRMFTDIGLFEERNVVYQQSLIGCLFEGVYNSDLSFIKNLRASDINDNIVTLRDDNGQSHTLQITRQLANSLKELGALNTTERKNRHGVFLLQVSGIYPDSCFKIETRDGANIEEFYKFLIYAQIKKITKEYCDHTLKPKDIYISGIMYRISLKLKEFGISMEDAFAYHSRNKEIFSIISEELKRCYYDIPVYNFREIVRGHLDVFEPTG